MLFVFLLFSYTVSASDTGEEIRKIHEILKQQQSQILKLQNDNKVLKAENILLRMDVDRLNEINSRVDHSKPDNNTQNDSLQKREEIQKLSTHDKGT